VLGERRGVRGWGEEGRRRAAGAGGGGEARQRWGRGGARAVGERRGQRRAAGAGGGGGGGLGFWRGRPYIREREYGLWWAVGPILALGSNMGWLCRE
jgi:hypothetical protein